MDQDMLIIGIAGMCWAMVLGNELYLLHRARASRTWPMVDGKLVNVTTTYNAPDHDDHHDGYHSPVVRVRYVYGKKTYHTSRMAFRRNNGWGNIGYSSARATRRATRRLFPGNHVRVAVNPTSPGESVILPGDTTAQYMEIAALVLGPSLVFGFWFIFSAA